MRDCEGRPVCLWLRTHNTRAALDIAAEGRRPRPVKWCMSRFFALSWSRPYAVAEISLFDQGELAASQRVVADVAAADLPTHRAPTIVLCGRSRLWAFLETASEAMVGPDLALKLIESHRRCARVCIWLESV